LLKQTLPVAIAAGALGAPPAHADAVTDWNVRSCEIVVASGLITQPASRVMAIAHTAAFHAANAIARRYPSERGPRLEGADGASVEAAIAAAHRTALVRLLPAQQPAIDEAYRTALNIVADGPAKEAGIAVGERAALAQLSARANDGATAPEAYRPYTTPGRYVPAVLNEIKAVGSRHSTVRTAEQTDIARFWETTAPPIYHGVVRSVAEMPGRDIVRNARLFAAVTQGIDDAMIAVFDAKYHHGFWRPITAIRNGDIDGNDATQADASWLPLITTPAHPEYPCAHCIQAGVVGAILQAELGSGPQPVLSTASASASGAVRRWSSVAAFVREVGNARVYDGVHFRFSTEVGTDMGPRIGGLVVQRFAGE
jgi:hypothetical protein